MTFTNSNAYLRLLLSALLALSIAACGDSGDTSSDDSAGETAAGETVAGETAAGEGSAGEGSAGEDAAGEDPAGEDPAGEDTAGEDPAGEAVAGETVAGEAIAGEAVAGEPAGGDTPEEEFVCAQDVLQIQSARITPTPNMTYLGVDDRFNYTNILQIEFLTLPGIGQSVSFEGVTPQNCEGVCVYVGVQCEEGGCAEVYFASQGSLTLTAGGAASGEEVTFEVSNLVLSRLNRENGDLDNSNTTCLSNQAISALQPTVVGDTIPQTFAIQNCETGDIVNVQEFGAEAKGIWYFATAGWCPACRQTLTYLYAEVFPTFTAETIRPMIVVSEDDQYRPATLAYCRSYGRRYADDASDFYLDANLDATFANVWPYLGDDGSFGLPWQAVFEGGTGTYLYGDGGPGVETLDDVLNALLQD